MKATKAKKLKATKTRKRGKRDNRTARFPPVAVTKPAIGRISTPTDKQMALRRTLADIFKIDLEQITQTWRLPDRLPRNLADKLYDATKRYYYPMPSMRVDALIMSSVGRTD